MRPIYFVAAMVVGFTATIATSYAMAEPAAPALDPMKTFMDNCSACHQPDGKGIPGAFPALAGDPFVVGPMDKPIGVVLNGRGGMPTFKADLTDDQIAAALTHVRTSWGNKASAVTPTDVAKLRMDAQPVPDKKPIQAH